jgi:uracil-DNA glycosylase
VPRTVASLRREAAACRRCPLWRDATQTVFGDGATRGLMLVGEQPGDVEDREGSPFVGPAGRLLRELLDESGVPPEQTYLTNAVKHFKWHASGKRRIHDRPSWLELDACNHWLRLELAAVSPALVVCLGATSAQVFFGRSARVGKLRGRRLALEDDTPALVTIHPSAVLRAGERRQAERAGLLGDLELARDLLAELVPVGRRRARRPAGSLPRRR